MCSFSFLILETNFITPSLSFSAFSCVMSLTVRRLIPHKYWSWPRTRPCGLLPPLPRSESVLAQTPDNGHQSRPADSSQFLAWVCWGRISLSAPENLPRRLPPVETKKKIHPLWKGRNPVLSCTNGVNHNAAGNGSILLKLNKKEIVRAGSRTSTAFLRSCLQRVHRLNQINVEARG